MCNRSYIVLLLGAEPVQLNVPPDEFYSKKITNKIVQQIHVILTYNIVMYWKQYHFLAFIIRKKINHDANLSISIF